jgi:uncharacterized membrane protein
MHRSPLPWLYSELPRLVEQGVLTPEAADAVRRHYGHGDSDALRSRWRELLLVGFGALLVGGGIILILAHNWDELGRPARAAIALGTLVIAQALTLYAVVRRGSSQPWLEGTSTFLVAAVGASIALVGQTYQVGGSFEGLMQTWLWLVALVPYLTGSILAAGGFWALLVVRTMDIGWRGAPPDLWLLALAGLPFVILRVRRQPESWATALLAIAAAASIFILGSFVAIYSRWTGLWSVFQVSFVAALAAIAYWPPREYDAEPWRARLLGPAWMVLVVLGTILSFKDVWQRVTVNSDEFRQLSVVITALVASAGVAVASIVTIRLARAGRRTAASLTSAAILVVGLHALALNGMQGAGWIAFNLWMLVVGALALIEGLRALDLGTTNRGLFALSALLLARFFDTDLSFLVRGLGFVALGGTCFALNIWLMRRVQRRAA